MIKQSKLSLAIQSASLALITSSLVGSPAFAQDDTDENTNVEVMHVTGSRIVRSADYQVGAQVIEIDRKMIDASGSLMIADVLRSSPLNAYGSFSERSGSSAQSNATVDLRGLGDERTLVTIDGRRMVGSPSLGASVTNVNMIPMAAVERVDILADGASAVYGSDAVAGVINMTMRKNFDGLEFNVRSGDRANDDGEEFSVSLLGGVSGDKGNITFAIENDSRDPIWDKDREYTSPWVRDTDGDGSIEAYVDTDGYSIYGSSIWLFDPETGYDRILASTNCAEGNGFLGVVDADIDWGYPSDLNENTYCMYGYADVSANKASLDRTSVYVNGNYEVNSRVNFYTTALVSRVESFGRFAPPAATWPDMPADYRDVPFDIDALIQSGEIGADTYSLTGFYRWTNIGPRDNVVTDTQFDFTVGFNGSLSDKISYDTYYQKSTYDVKEYGYYYLSYPGLDYVLNNDIDPFSEEGAGAMSATTTQDNFTKMDKLYGHIQVGLADLAGGELIALFGFEQMDISYQNKYDRASEAGFVGGSSGNSSLGEREITALFSEVVIPLIHSVEINAALRYDDYSDFGSALSPSISATWGLTSDVVLRGRWGQGFRAPGLDQLYGPQTFSAESASDQTNCALNDISPEDCGTAQYDTYFYTNPDLDAEDSESLSFGVNWNILDGLNVDLAWYDISIENQITQPTTQSIFYAEAAGYNFDPSTNTWVDRSGGRAVVHSGYVNQGQLGVSGIDFRLGYDLETGFGQINNDLLITKQLSSEQEAYFSGPSQETAGFNLQPEVMAQWALGWSLAQHSIDLVVNYTGASSIQDFISFDSSGNAFLETSDEDLDTWTTLNLSYSFDAGKWGKISVGATNLTNEDPVLDRTGKYDVTHYELYDSTGRVTYVSFSLKM